MDILDQWNVIKMLNKQELLAVTGGGTITSSMLNAIARGISTITDLGRALGSAIRRMVSGKICPIP